MRRSVVLGHSYRCMSNSDSERGRPHAHKLRRTRFPAKIPSLGLAVNDQTFKRAQLRPRLPFAMPTFVSVTPNLRPASALQSFAEAKQDVTHTRCSNAPPRTSVAVAAVLLTDIHKLSPFGGGGFVGRPPCASDQWFIRFRTRQWLTSWTSLSYSFTPRLPSLVTPALFVLPFSCFNIQTLLLPFGVRACRSMCRQLFVASRMYLRCWRSTR